MGLTFGIRKGLISCNLFGVPKLTLCWTEPDIAVAMVRDVPGRHRLRGLITDRPPSGETRWIPAPPFTIQEPTKLRGKYHAYLRTRHGRWNPWLCYRQYAA